MIKRIYFLMIIFCCFVVLLFFALNYIFPLDTTKISMENSLIIYDKNNKILSMKTSTDGFWVYDSQEFPQILKQSVILFEDRYFYYHFGFNIFSIFRSLYHNIFNDNRVGASTISMQIARMMEPKNRSYFNKIIEIFRAVQLELKFSKDEILNIYLNIAPYGSNIYGAKAAAFFYFNKSLQDLSISEMALLSTIPKNPNKNRLDKKSNIFVFKNRVLTKLYNSKIIDISQLKRAMKENVANHRFNSIQRAYHFSNIAFKNKIIYTKLDLDLQDYIENQANNLMSRLSAKKANNLSAVVIDNVNMEVVAYVGSHNLRSKNGFNDGVMAKKSVGSILKPFIYAKAIDSGLITPKQKLVDTNVFFGTYSPKNFFNDFLGKITASEALNFSINTLAVFLNNKLGNDSLYELLKKAELISQTKDYYGQSIALGSVDISLLDLAHLYTAFANGGEILPLKVGGLKIDKHVRLFSKQASYIVSKILTDGLRSYLNSFWQNTLDTPMISFKTGTSAEFKDLYAVGYNKNYTVAIWIGNFDSSPTQNLSGSQTSLKLLFEVFKFLSQREKMSFFQMPDNLEIQNICVDEFLYDKCKNFADDLVIKNLKLSDKCDFLTNEQINYLVLNNYVGIDEFLKSPCIDRIKSQKPIIASPPDGVNFLLNWDENSTKIMIKCLSFLGDEIFVKIDDNDYFKMQSNQEIIVELNKGFHEFRCLDKNSNLTKSTIVIKELK